MNILKVGKFLKFGPKNPKFGDILKFGRNF